MNTCTTAPAPLPIWLVTLDVYDGGSDEFAQPQAHRVSREQCAPTAHGASATVLAWARDEDIGEVFGVEVDPTYPLAFGNGSASCVT